jgi:hypothetical protein
MQETKTAGRFSGAVWILFLPVIFASVLQSQTVFGVDVSDPGNTKGYMFNNANDAAGSDVYLKYDTGIFDRITLNKNIGYSFIIFNPTANRLVQVYDSLVSAFGYENEILDSIPKGIAEDDFTEITHSILDGKGKILRFWYKEKFNVKLEFTSENLRVLLAYN